MGKSLAKREHESTWRKYVESVRGMSLGIQTFNECPEKAFRIAAAEGASVGGAGGALGPPAPTAPG